MSEINVSEKRVTFKDEIPRIVTVVTFKDGMKIDLDDRYDRAEAIHRALLLRRNRIDQEIMDRWNNDEFLGSCPDDRED